MLITILTYFKSEPVNQFLKNTIDHAGIKYSLSFTHMR